jgi:cytochrome c5
MTSQRSACILSVVVLSAAFLILCRIGNVQAGTVSAAPVVPARFFSEMAVPPAAGFAFFQAGDAPLPDGKGKDLVQKDCSNCHALNVVTKQHNTKQQWSDVMDDMVSKGLDASDEEIATMTAYLNTNFGPVKKDPPPTPPSPAP